MNPAQIESKLIEVFLANQPSLYADLPFDNQLSRFEKHLLLNKMAKEIFESVSKVNKIEGHIVLGISFHPKYIDPQPVMKDVSNTDNPIKDKKAIYDFIVEEGLEVFCVISSKYLILEDYFSKKQNGIYYAFGTSFGQERGIWNEETQNKLVLTFSQPTKQSA